MVFLGVSPLYHPPPPLYTIHCTYYTYTITQSPQFATSARSRPPKVKSTAELEEEALAHAGTFKAKPIKYVVLVVACFAHMLLHIMYAYIQFAYIGID